MFGSACKHMAMIVAMIVAGIVQPAAARSPGIGIVIMHGKGGSPTKHVADLASSLEGKGYLVANLDMPWSGQRDYDANVAAAEKQVESALESLRAKGQRNCLSPGTARAGFSRSISAANIRSMA